MVQIEQSYLIRARIQLEHDLATEITTHMLYCYECDPILLNVRCLRCQIVFNLNTRPDEIASLER